MLHGRITMLHGRITMLHGRITMLHGRITMLHGRITMLHGRITMRPYADRWPLCPTPKTKPLYDKHRVLHHVRPFSSTST
jgi:hypothetical protein